MDYVMLKDVCAINMGQSPDSDSYNDKGEGVPFFQGNADFGERYPVTRKWCTSPTKMAEPEDILISVRAPIGAMNYAKEECCIGRGLAALTPDKSKVSPEFIFWLLKGKKEELNSKGTGSTFKAIGRNVLEETLVPDIGLEKQKEFSKAIEKVYAIIQSRKQELQKLDELIKSRFVKLFGDPTENPNNYPIKRIDEVAELIKGITYSPEDVCDKDGVIVLRSSNIKGSSFDLQDIVTISKKISSEKTVKENDILMCNRNGSARLVGKVALIPKLDEDMTFGTFMTIVRCQMYKYLFVFFQMEAFRRQIQFQTAVAINQISLPLLAGVTVPIPPMELQEQFAAFVEQVDKLKSEVQRSLDETQLLMDSLMQKYFG